MFKKISLVLIMILFSFITISTAKTIHNFGDFNNVEYVRNYDGDTITVNILCVHPLLGYHINIRIRGIDCPEIRSKYIKEHNLAITAKKAVQELCRSNQPITLKNVQRGKYFRIIADVFIGNNNLNKYLLDNHLAVPYNGRTKIDWCKELNKK